MLKKQIFGIMWIIAAIVAVYVFVDQKIIKDYSIRNSPIETINNVPDVEEIKRDIVTPLPLYATTTSNILNNKIVSSQLITLTNSERQKIGLSTLGDNVSLDHAALAKAKDMFAKQYFDHLAPSGENAGDFAKKENYDYFIIGENLASGGFKNAEAIINAWMASQGHKENILNPKYREMGAAVLFGKFEGKSTLFAVQIFGTPTSICPKPDESSKLKIDNMSEIINTKKQTLDTMYQGIDISNRNDVNVAKINEYNLLVKEYNNLADNVKSLIEAYNDQVRQFIECATAAAR